MRLANRGDASAYRRLLELLATRLRLNVRHGLRRAGRSIDDTEDIVQETLLAIHLKRHTWDEGQPLEPWARAIAHYKLVDALRRRGFREHVPIEDYAEVLGEQPTGSEAIEQRELLDQLSERQRAIVQGISVEGFSAREMGDRLGMTEGAVRIALHRALKMLAATLRGRDQ